MLPPPEVVLPPRIVLKITRPKLLKSIPECSKKRASSVATKALTKKGDKSEYLTLERFS